MALLFETDKFTRNWTTGRRGEPCYQFVGVDKILSDLLCCGIPGWRLVNFWSCSYLYSGLDRDNTSQGNDNDSDGDNNDDDDEDGHDRDTSQGDYSNSNGVIDVAGREGRGRLGAWERKAGQTGNRAE